MDLYQAISYPLYVGGILEVILGIALLRNAPLKSRASRACAALFFFAAAFVLCTAISYTLASHGRDYNFFNRFSWIGWFMIPAGLQFVYYLQGENSRAARLVGSILYPFWGAVLLLTLFTDLVEPGDPSLIPFVALDGPLENPLRVIGTIMAFWLLIELYRTKNRMTGVIRAQMGLFFLGTLFFNLGCILIGGILPIFGAINPALTAFFSLPWVVISYYAITRHQLFDLRLLISRVLNIALLSLLLAFIHLGLFELFLPSLGDTLAILLSLAVIGLILFGTRFSRSLQQWVQRLVLQNRYDYQLVLKESARAILTILDPDELLASILDGMKKSLAVENVCLVLREQDAGLDPQQGNRLRIGGPTKRPMDNAVIDWLQSTGTLVVREELAEAPNENNCSPVQAYMNVLGCELIIPLFYQGNIKGFIALGKKGNGDPYFESDTDLLTLLAGHVVVALENARLFEKARQAQESLRESEAKFRSLAQTVPAAIFIHRDGRVLYANPIAEVLTGYTQEELLFRDFPGLAHPAFRDRPVDRGLNRLAADTLPSQDEFKIVRKDGGERWVLMTSTLLEYEGRTSVIGTLVDITDRKALEGKLRYAQKMETVGKMAGGVAHDFNNILTAIVGFGSLLQSRIAKDDPMRSFVEKILSATERASNLTQSLVAFGNKQVVNLKSEDLSVIVRNMEKLLSGFVREDIRLSIRTMDRSLPVLADIGQIERIIMNLLVNARDAMPDGGDVTIETKTETLGAEFRKIHGFGSDGTYAVIAVQDTGTGMDKAVREKIFEPYFTTKGFGKGTGFGLSIVYDIVKEHHGYIVVDSEPGRGAMFMIYLPLAAEKSGETAPLSAPVRAVLGSETVLVAENDDHARAFMKAILEGGGYSIIEASDGEDAISQFNDHADRVQLLILNAIMPKMNGGEAYDAICVKRPAIKVLFASGYHEQALFPHGTPGCGRNFLKKPFEPNELLARVREVLDQPLNTPR